MSHPSLAATRGPTSHPGAGSEPELSVSETTDSRNERLQSAWVCVQRFRSAHGKEASSFRGVCFLLTCSLPAWLGCSLAHTCQCVSPLWLFPKCLRTPARHSPPRPPPCPCFSSPRLCPSGCLGQFGGSWQPWPLLWSLATSWCGPVGHACSVTYQW